MSNVKITVEINGQEYDIKDCAWYVIAPCGCTSGVMTTRDYTNNSWITSVEQAEAELTENRAVREQNKARGEKVEIGLHADCMTRLKGECPHTPRWGRQPIPDGTAWGRSSSGRSAHVIDKELPDDSGDFRHHWREPKCGAKRDLFEIHPSVLQDAPMCKKCLTYAEAEVAA